MANQRFTVYDVMEGKGVFRVNPANAGAQSPDGTVLYQGPVQYPKMMYHPKGEERVVSEGELINTPAGPKLIGMHKELIFKMINNEAEETEAKKVGWHSHPALAIAAAGKEAPAITATQTIDELKKEIARLQAQQMLLEQQAKKA